MRNCRNRRGLRHSVLKGRDEWKKVSPGIPHVLKIGDIKFFECPLSAVKPRTWDLMRLVNETALGEHMEQLYLPEPGTIMDQSPRYREAIGIVRHQRAEHRRRELEKRK